MKQIRELIQFIKGFLNSQNKKKIIENSAIVIILGIIVIIAGGAFFGKSETKSRSFQEEVKEDNTVKANTSVTDEKNDIEKRIETILSMVDGAGKVEVMVTYMSGKELVPAYDTKKNENDTQEKDSGGGIRNIKQNDLENKVVFSESQGGTKDPVILKERQPEVKGVVVVADGATDVDLKDSLLRAVQVLLDVPPHKIQVLERRK